MKLNISQLEFPKASSQTVKALDIVASADPDLKELERVILQDPLLASTVIRYANSPLYRSTRNITNVQNAIQLLGIKSIRSAIVSASMRSILPGDNPIGKKILSHLIEISIICRLIAEKCCNYAIYDLEFLGLFHNIGMLILAANFHQEYEDLVYQAIDSDVPVDVLEQQLFGLSHGAVSEHAAHEFRLPANISSSLKLFNNRGNVPEDKYASILIVAHCIWKEFNCDKKVFNEISDGEYEQFIKYIGLSETQNLEIMKKLREMMETN